MPSELSTLEQAGILTGVIAGVGGLTVSMVGLLFQWREARTRLGVRFAICTQVEGNVPERRVEHDVGVVEVVNTGRVSAVPTQVGIETRKGKALLVIAPTPLDGGPWPRELAPGAACHLRFDSASLREQARTTRFKRAYVRTAIGQMFRGPRNDMKALKKQLLMPLGP